MKIKNSALTLILALGFSCLANASNPIQDELGTCAVVTNNKVVQKAPCVITNKIGGSSKTATVWLLGKSYKFVGKNHYTRDEDYARNKDGEIDCFSGANSDFCFGYL